MLCHHVPDKVTILQYVLSSHKNMIILKQCTLEHNCHYASSFDVADEAPTHEEIEFTSTQFVSIMAL